MATVARADDGPSNATGSAFSGLANELSLQFEGRYETRLGYAPQAPDSNFPFNRGGPDVAEWSNILDLGARGKYQGVMFRAAFKVDDVQLYDQAYQDQYPKNERDLSKVRLLPDETYADVTLADGVWLRHGMQVLSWGNSDAFRVLDVLSPHDDRFWAQEDALDSRLPLWSTKLTINRESWDGDFALIHRFQNDLIAGAGSDYDPFILWRQRGSDVFNPQGPRDYVPEWAARVRYRFDGGDVTPMLGQVYERAATLKYTGFDMQSGLLDFQPVYGRISVQGLSANYTIGSLLLKTDIARKEHVSNFNNNFFTTFNPFGANQPTVVPRTTDEEMVGAEYTGISDTVLSAEFYSRQVERYLPGLLGGKFGDGYMLSAMRSFKDDTLHATLRYVNFVGQVGDFYTASLVYDVLGDSKVGAAYVRYIGGDPTLGFIYPQRRNDRLLVSWTTQF